MHEFRQDRYRRNGDQSPLIAAGFTAVRFTEWAENFHHQHQNVTPRSNAYAHHIALPQVRNESGVEYGDLLKFLDPIYHARVTGVNLATIASLALAPSGPRNVTLDIAVLTNKSTIEWNAPNDATLARLGGFVVLRRETASPIWQDRVFVPLSARQPAGAAFDFVFTSGFSKDNYFFGVASVDKSGHESLPVFVF